MLLHGVEDGGPGVLHGGVVLQPAASGDHTRGRELDARRIRHRVDVDVGGPSGRRLRRSSRRRAAVSASGGGPVGPGHRRRQLRLHRALRLPVHVVDVAFLSPRGPRALDLGPVLDSQVDDVTDTPGRGDGKGKGRGEGKGRKRGARSGTADLARGRRSCRRGLSVSAVSHEALGSVLARRPALALALSPTVPGLVRRAPGPGLSLLRVGPRYGHDRHGRHDQAARRSEGGLGVRALGGPLRGVFDPRHGRLVDRRLAPGVRREGVREGGGGRGGRRQVHQRTAVVLGGLVGRANSPGPFRAAAPPPL